MWKNVLVPTVDSFGHGEELLVISLLFSVNWVNIEEALGSRGGCENLGRGAFCPDFTFVPGLKFSLVGFSPDEAMYTATEMHGGLNKAHRKTSSLCSITSPSCLNGIVALENV